MPPPSQPGPAEVDAPLEGRPTDACPYERPFAEDFKDCPAYAARRFVPFDSLHRPLTPIWTCTFLVPRRAADTAHGYYASCSLGSADERAAWIEEIRRDRFDQLSRLQREAAELAAPYVERVAAAKARLAQGGASEVDASAELGRLLGELEDAISGFLEANSARLEAAALPVSACKELVTLAIRDMVGRRHLRNYAFTPPASLVEKFPAEVRAMIFRPPVRSD
ncbi:MAG: hypothetical protein ABR573_08025 [Candidatus Dormibacteria bacterium]